ncbi:MAG: ABC transporter permease subunit [Phycisphaerales bacterium]|nr:MAG: ABC transporter permease subunit [Phycisphaerales bacterium]
MRNITTMVQRELGAYFLSPIAYAVSAVFLFATGLAFALGTFRNGAEASLRSLIEFWVVVILVFVLPMLTMRLVSEELRSGTIETLMTVPITEIEVVLGKFFGALVFYLILLATLLVYPIVLSMFGPVDAMLLVCNYIGLLLLGALYISVGLFFSAFTRHQIIAVLLSFALLALMTFASHGLAQTVDGWPKAVLQHLSVRTHFFDFVRGMVDMNHVIFFLTTTALFLFLTVKRVEMRRWQ